MILDVFMSLLVKFCFVMKQQQNFDGKEILQKIRDTNLTSYNFKHQDGLKKCSK